MKIFEDLLRSVTTDFRRVDGSLIIEFQNEFLITSDDDEVLVSVPDLICIVDKDTGLPITTDTLRYGQRVQVIGVPAPDLLTTNAALEVIGPSAFGYDIPYVPLEDDESTIYVSQSTGRQCHRRSEDNRVTVIVP